MGCEAVYGNRLRRKETRTTAKTISRRLNEFGCGLTPILKYRLKNLQKSASSICGNLRETILAPLARAVMCCREFHLKKSE
jgi:hypothetical protein